MGESQSRYSIVERLTQRRLDIISQKLELEEDLIEKKHEEAVSELRSEAYEVEQEIEQLEEEKRKRERELKSKRSDILASLEAYTTPVFKKANLNEKEVKALLHEGFEQVNEFCVYEMKRIPVLVKPESNHSVTHAFLVWSAKRLISHLSRIKNIEEHLSKDADITFDFNGKEYALEIETGTLLGKKEQTREKINYLNRKYEGRWMFIVSNRDLFGKYNKLGFTSQRKDVLKNIQKMLKEA